MLLAASPLNQLGPQRVHSFAVVCIFRNEAHVIKEWVDHYRHFGADHIYMINNNSTDGYIEALSDDLATGFVELFNCATDRAQNRAYNELLPRLAVECDWVGAFDLDEFIFPVTGKSFTAEIATFGPVSAILVPWLSFGSSGHIKQPTSVVRSFTTRGEGHVSRALLKPIFRPAQTKAFTCHNVTLRVGTKVLSNGLPFGDAWHVQLQEEEVEHFSIINNHYRLQSRGYYMSVKVKRPEANEDADRDRKRVGFFDENDARWSTVTDRRLCILRGYEPTPNMT